MPVIGVPVEDLTARIQGDVEREQLLEVLGNMGCDVEGFATLRRVKCVRCGFVMELAGKEEVSPECGNCSTPLRDVGGSTEEMSPVDVVRMELLAVRPDMFDPAGLARAIRGVLGLETGMKEYAVGKPIAKLRVDDSVRREESLRPHIACAVLENVRFDDDSIKVLMKLQENLHWALGRNRKHASIGVYDLDSLSGETEFVYTTEPPSFRFVPLGHAEDSDPVDLDTILAEHPKGRAYAHLLESFDRYPILRASGGRVLSMPPIINSEETRVHKGSTRLIIDVTGTGSRIANRTLNILLTSLMEYHPEAILRVVEIENATATEESSGATVSLQSPDFTHQEMWVDADATTRLLGIPTEPDTLRDLLEKMRHEIAEVDGRKLKVRIPSYRNDILHERDLMEDAAIAFGYGNIPRTLVPTMTVGRDLPSSRVSDQLRDVMIGMGFLEVFTLALTSAEQSDGMLGRDDHPRTVLLDNPISSDQTQLRTSLMPGILDTIVINRTNALPQMVFEIGEISMLGSEFETGAGERLHLCFGAIATKVGFAEARAWVEALVREIGWPLGLEEATQPFLIEGRAANILGPGGVVVGIVGEVHPRLLAKLGLRNPMVLCELAVTTGKAVTPYDALP